MAKYIVTTANVFIPAEIRYTNISSTYLPADVLNKLLKALGKDSTLVAGVDVYGKHAHRALKLAENKDKYINECKTKFRNTLKLWGIEPDLYIDSDNVKMDYKLTEDNYKQFLSGTYKNLIKYFHRLSPILSGKAIDIESEEYKTIENHILNGRVNKVVSTIEQWAVDDLKEISKDNHNIKKIGNRYAIITKVMGAIAPNIVKELNHVNTTSQVKQAIMEKKYDYSK